MGIGSEDAEGEDEGEEEDEGGLHVDGTDGNIQLMTIRPIDGSFKHDFQKHICPLDCFMAAV